MTRGAVLVVGAVAVGLLLLTRRPAAAAGAPPLTQQGNTTMDQHPLYSARLLTADQQRWADAIIGAFQPAGGDAFAAWALALAVTESSLRATITGDDGISLGLFQLQVSTALPFDPDASPANLLDGTRNIADALLAAEDLLTRYPNHTWGDYAEAWTLGGHGRFDLQRRNPTKVAAMQRAITDLALALDLNGGPDANAY